MANVQANTGNALTDALKHGGRIRRFRRPDGRHVHVAATPEEAEHLKLALSGQDPEEGFDLIVHGSPEHLTVVRDLHTHQEGRRESLRQKHADLYAEFEDVQAELEALSVELHTLTDLGVDLDANFSRYGYSAHIRTREPESSANSIKTSPNEARNWNGERQSGVAMKFWKRPVVRQYMHKGLLWRASEREEVASFELFVDLLYVGIIAINGGRAADNPTGASLLQFCITFIISWKLWSDLTLVISWFETDDILQRLSILFIVACLTGTTVNISEASTSTYSPLIAFYLTQRLFGAFYYSWVGYLIPMIRGTMIANTIAVVIPSLLWIGSIHVQGPNRLILIWLAIPLDLFGSGTIVGIVYLARRFEGAFWARIVRLFDFHPAVNIEHKTDRTNAFVTLVFGYSVVGLLYQNQAPFGINAFFGKAILGLIQSFTFNWLYFEIDSFNLHCHAIRRHMFSFMFWMTLHLPFIMSFVLAAAALSKLVVASDCSDADPMTLAMESRRFSETEISPGLRWFYCAGLGIALACMGGISMTHEHKEVKGQRIGKRLRLTVRFAVALVLICLPLTQHLDSLRLISTTTGLVVSVLLVDLYGSTCVSESFWQDKRKCKYSAECRLRKKDLETAVKSGARVNVEELARQDLGEKGVHSFN